MKNNSSRFVGGDLIALSFVVESLLSLRFLFLILAATSVVFLSHREVFLSGFSKLMGDRYDLVIMSTILEHWKNFWSGASSWHDVGYFYPYSRSIAQTDGYFLIGIIFSLVRLFIDDIFLSVAFTSIVLSGLGFFSMYVLLRNILGFQYNVALLIALTFVACNSLVGHGQRLQLLSVYLLPLLTSFLVVYLRGISCRKHDFVTVLSGVLFGLMYGAMTITCFYIAWFYFLFLFVFFCVLLFSNFRFVLGWFESFIDFRSSSIFVFTVLFLSVVPFVWAYYPKSLEVGVRSYSSVSINLVLPLELMQVGFDNYLYGGFLGKLFQFVYPGYVPRGEYYNVGFSPLVILLFLASILFFHSRSGEGINYYFLIGVSVLICCALVVKVGSFSLWYVVYNLIPGAKALNVVSVFLMVLVFPVLVVIGKYIELQKFHIYFFAVLSICIIVGELGSSYVNFDVKQERSRIADVAAPPAGCTAFYVSGYDEQAIIPGFPEWVNSMYAHNVTAMLLSQKLRLPTLNGVASFNPPDWNFSSPWATDYDQRVLQYAQKHSVRDFCKLNLNTKLWTQVK